MSNYIRNIAIVGAAGKLGRFIVSELLAGGKHEVTAITRGNSTNALPVGVKAARVDYDDHSTLVAALRGQEALVITMNVLAPRDSQSKLIAAAAEANVPYVLHNCWSPPTTNEQFTNDILLGYAERAARKQIEDLGRSSWIGMITGFWYEYSLGGGPNSYGLDWPAKTMTFYGDGTTKLNTITWPQSGLAVARVLSLPIQGTGPTLSGFKNKFVYVSSFHLSQKDMFEAVLQVSGTKREAWTIQYEDAEARYKAGKALMQSGDRSGFQKMLYARVFFPDAQGDFEDRLDNAALGLPQEDLEMATMVAIERAEAGKGYAA